MYCIQYNDITGAKTLFPGNRNPRIQEQGPNVEHVLLPATEHTIFVPNAVVMKSEGRKTVPVGRANRSKRHDRRVAGCRNSNKLALFRPEHLVFLTL